MRVSAIEVVSREETCQIQAWVESDFAAEDARSFEPFLLWYRFPAWCEAPPRGASRRRGAGWDARPGAGGSLSLSRATARSPSRN